MKKGALLGGIGGATLGAAVGVGVAAVALGPFALLIAPAAIIGAGAAGAFGGGASGAAIGHKLDKMEEATK